MARRVEVRFSPTFVLTRICHLQNAKKGKQKKKKKGKMKTCEQPATGEEQAAGENAAAAQATLQVVRTEEADAALQAAMASEDLESIVSMPDMELQASHSFQAALTSMPCRSAPSRCIASRPAMALWQRLEPHATSSGTKRRRPRSSSVNYSRQGQQQPI